MIEKKIPVTNNKLLGRLTRLPPKYIYYSNRKLNKDNLYPVFA